MDKVLKFNNKDKSFQEIVDPSRYRLGVAVVLQSASNGRFLFALRSDEEGQGDWVVDDQGEWVMPQGGLDKGENPKETLLRELKEETGISNDLVEFVSDRNDFLAYDFEPLIEPATWIGQAHKWYFCRFLGDPINDIDLNSQLPAEFQDFKWATGAEICDRAQDFHREVYKKVLKEFGLLEAPSIRVKKENAPRL